MANFNGDPEHPILPEPFRWELVEFSFRRSESDWKDCYIDMLFARDGEERRLRFYGPRDLEIIHDLPVSSGMCILDVTARQLDDLRVRVANFEGATGAPPFWASQVVDLLHPDSGPGDEKYGESGV